MEENELKMYVREYSNEVYRLFPNFFKYLVYINTSAGYMEDIRYNTEEYIEEEFEYEYNVDFNYLIKVTTEILDTIDVRLKDKFLKYLCDGTIIMCDEEDRISSTSVDNNHLDISIKRNYNIEDIFGTIHEFFHGIHLEKFNLEFYDNDWFSSTELVAIIGELYTLFYLIEKEECAKDLHTYYKKFMSSVFMHNYVTLENGIFIDLYDKMQDITEESLAEYIVMNNLPESYINLLCKDDEDVDTDEFEFHISGTYAFAVPLAFLVARRMILDESYRHNIFPILENIGNYDLNTLFDKLGITEYLENEDKLFELMNFINVYTSKYFRKEKVLIKDNKELW